MYSYEPRPHCACTFPYSSSSILLLFKSIKSTVPYSYLPFSDELIPLISNLTLNNCIQVVNTSSSPTNNGLHLSYISELIKDLDVISGPMHAGSTIGIAKIAFSFGIKLHSF